MMPTNDERREVAANLKSLSGVVPRGDNDAAGFIEALDDVLFDFGPNELGDIANRLADLIEPEPKRTCRNIAEPPKDGGFWPVPHFKCSECGGTHVSIDYVTFCPNCGAEVRDDVHV